MGKETKASSEQTKTKRKLPNTDNTHIYTCTHASLHTYWEQWKCFELANHIMWRSFARTNPRTMYLDYILMDIENKLSQCNVNKANDKTNNAMF